MRMRAKASPSIPGLPILARQTQIEGLAKASDAFGDGFPRTQPSDTEGASEGSGEGGGVGLSVGITCKSTKVAKDIRQVSHNPCPEVLQVHGETVPVIHPGHAVNSQEDRGQDGNILIA